MPTRIAINGFGRIGRGFVRAAAESGSDLEIVAVNDVTDAATLAHLLAYDSIYGRFPGNVHAADGMLHAGDVSMRALSERNPENLPWDDLEVDVVIESTGKFRTHNDASLHLEAGANKVILSAPIKGEVPADANIVLGVNDHVYDPDRHHIITNASCTTNCLAPVAGILHGSVGILHGLMTTIHAYTSDQNLHDAPHKDLRRARAAAVNLVPTSTGAAKAVGLVIPELAGRLHGYAVRVPTATGSIVDLTVETERPTSVEEINAIFAERADRGSLAGILAYNEDPIVSSDIVKSPYSAIFDAPLTSVVDRTQVKVVAWYDNEWGYSNRLVELAARVMAPVPAGAS
jgi:glyceraldehyde 3-phosphate dehydrogenase